MPECFFKALPRLLVASLVGVSVMASDTPAVSPTESDRTVVLLHGLARSSKSMQKMAEHLVESGFRVCNIDYPSTDHAIETLARDYVQPAIEDCLSPRALNEGAVDFVTHSMGGILVRQLDSTAADLVVGRVVMLGPPNAGSEVVDRIGQWTLFDWINGPAGQELATSATSTPRQLGAIEFPLGVIAGRHSINWINSWMIPGPDDGKVAVARARVAGMTDFRVLPVTHPYMMRDREVIAETVHFLREGKFSDVAESE